MSELDLESFDLGLIWGIALVVVLIRFELWLHRPTRPAPADPFDTLRWEVLQAARQVTQDAAG
jgi:hypothetical protein